MSTGVSGDLSPTEALSRLLAGTGLTFRLDGGDAVRIERVPQAASGSIQLGPVRVEGATTGTSYATPPTATIGRSPEAYPGGQVARGARLGVLGNRDYMDTPFNTSSYTSLTLQDQHAQDLIDVAVNEPAVRAIYGPNTNDDRLVIRGFLYANETFDGLGSLLPATKDISGIDRIEFLKGPTALVNGISSNSGVGGAVNFVPKRAEEQPLTQLSVGFSGDSLFSGHLDVGRRFGTDGAFGVRLNAVYKNGDTAIDNNALELENLSIGADYRSDETRLSLDVTRQRIRYEGIQVGVYFETGIPNAPDGSINFYQPWTYSDSEFTIASGRLEHDLAPNVTMFAAAGALWSTTSFLGQYGLSVSLDGTAAMETFVDPSFNDAVSTEAGIRSNFRTGPFKHEITLAASYTAETIGDRFVSLPGNITNIYRPVFVAAPARSTFDMSTPDKSSGTRSSSVALIDIISIIDGRAQLTLGIRRQQVETLSYSSTGARTTQYNEGKFTPAIAFLVKPTDKISVFGNYVQALEVGPTAPMGTVNVGQIFPPATTKQYELGIKGDFQGIGATLSAFDITRPSGVTDTATNRFSVDGEQRNRGVELNVFGEIAPGLRPLGGIAYLDARLTSTQNGANDGNRAAGIPHWQINFGMEWDPRFAPGLTLVGRFIHTGSSALDDANSAFYRDWSRLDAGARYSVSLPSGEALTLRATVTNALGSKYWIGSSNYGLQGPPRTLTLSATISF